MKEKRYIFYTVRYRYLERLAHIKIVQSWDKEEDNDYPQTIEFYLPKHIDFFPLWERIKKTFYTKIGVREHSPYIKFYLTYSTGWEEEDE